MVLHLHRPANTAIHSFVIMMIGLCKKNSHWNILGVDPGYLQKRVRVRKYNFAKISKTSMIPRTFWTVEEWCANAYLNILI